MFRTKSNKVLTLSLIVIAALLITMTATSTPAHAGVMQWTTVDTPGNAFNVIVSPSEINAIAVAPDGVTIYATDIPRGKVYKSTNGGFVWDDITGLLTASGATMPVWNIAIAADNPNIVAVVTSVGGLPRNVFLSADAGNRWQDTSYPAANNIGALDISPNYKNYDVVVGTRTGGGGGKVSIYKFPGYSGWADQGFTGDVLATKFSPSYAGDNSLAIVSSNATGTFVNLGIRDTSANTTNWSTWTPVEITTSGAGTSPKVNQIRTADLELPLDFVGQVAGQRHIYINTNDAGATGNAGIYRIDDNIIYKLMPATGTRMISSIAFIGPNNSGKLLAGEVKANASLATVDTWFSPNAGAACPQATCIIWQKSVKSPTGGANSGNANAQVAWGFGGTRTYCGTSSANLDAAGWPNGYLTTMALDESAFSISLDDGKNWNQISLIDTAINFLSDVAASVNSDTLYLASINTNAGLNGFDSLWRSTSQPLGRVWERTLCVLATSNDTIVRLIPSAQAVQSVFLGIRNTNDLYHSIDKGQTWNKALPGVNITDFTAIEIGGIPNLFVLENTSVRRGEYSGQMWKWGQKSGTTLNSGHSIIATASGTVVVGDAGEGMVAYSMDNGIQFTRLPPIPVPGNVHSSVDTRIGSNLVIYAATGKVYSYVVGAASSWIPMAAPSQSFYGLAQLGTLYCIWSSGGTSGVNRTLNPEALRAPFVEWSNMTAGLSAGVVFTREPIALKISDGVDMWAIDNRPYTANTGRLWTYCDCLTPVPSSTPQRPAQEFLFQAPALLSPAMNAIIPIDSASGEIADIEFEWQQPAQASGYDLWIARDKEFTQPVLQQSILSKTTGAPKWTLSSPEKSSLETGKSYYWKVRVNRNVYYQKGEGPWSETLPFSTGSKPASAPQSGQPILNLLTPANNATNVNRSPMFSWTPLAEASEYEFALARDDSFQQIVLSRTITEASLAYNAELDWGSRYYWQVRAIKPSISQSSPVFSFTVVTKDEAKPPPPSQIPDLPIWLWLLIAFLIIAILVAVIVVATTRHSPSKS